MKTTPWLVLAAAVCLAAPARASVLEIADAHIDPRDSRAVRVEFTAGALTVVGSDDDRIHIELTAECERDRERCLEDAERIRVVTQYASDAYRIRLTDTKHFGNHAPKLRLVVTVPRRLAVSIDMKAGELEVRGVESNVEVDMSAGEVSVDLPEEAVRSVDVRVAVGDASMNVPGPDPEADGWLGKRILWHEGRGDASVKIGLAAGDVSVRLR